MPVKLPGVVRDRSRVRTRARTPCAFGDRAPSDIGLTRFEDVPSAWRDRRLG